MIITGWHALSLLLHLVALALWLGGMVFFLVVFGPSAHELRPGIGVRTLNQGRIALEAVSWTAIGLLVITGTINLILASDGAGMAQGRFYAITLSVKLFFFFAMLVHHCLQVFKYAPPIAALTAQTPADATVWPEPLRTHWQKWFMLLKLNAGLGPIVVLLGVALAKG
jgi:putative copper resistance protein D